MSQERWDVVLRFVAGPLSFQGDMLCRGPVVRMGNSPGPGGVVLSGYRGIDDRQAVITAYDGGTVAIAPVGSNQVRVAEHENVDWSILQPIRAPVYLAPGSAFHLGSPGRGVTVVFVEAQRLGTWEQRRIISDASQASTEVVSSDVKEIDAQRGVPIWFVPGILVTGLATVFCAGAALIQDIDRDYTPLGARDDGFEYYDRVVDIDKVELPEELREGLNHPMLYFVMQSNADAAGWPELGKNPALWDPKFVTYVAAAVRQYNNKPFYRRLEEIVDDYGEVVELLREAKLPEVFAAIPYQESRYRATEQSYVCARGFWQLMPETAHRVGVEVKDCSIKGTRSKYTPTRLTPVYNVIANAEYVGKTPDGDYVCKLGECAVDDRTDLTLSTQGAIEALREAWKDDFTQGSGAAVQMTILSHNAGFDDSRYDKKKKSATNIRNAYEKFARKNRDTTHHFYGANLTCEKERSNWVDPARTNDRCGGLLANQTQHYGYSIVAAHFLAVCYYALNHSSKPVFAPWRKEFLTYDEYCDTLKVPRKD